MLAMHELCKMCGKAECEKGDRTYTVARCIRRCVKHKEHCSLRGTFLGVRPSLILVLRWVSEAIAKVPNVRFVMMSHSP
jgi:hypothetical protein